MDKSFDKLKKTRIAVEAIHHLGDPGGMSAARI
jgi:hypothetical protein